MKKYKGYSILMGLALTVMLLIVSACSAPGASGSNGNSSLPVLQVLQNSANAMQKLKSVHFDTTANASFQGTSSSSPGAITVNLKANGDEQAPNEQAHLSLNNMFNLSEIVTADKVYVQNTQGQWYVLDKSALKGSAGNLFNGSNIFNINTLMSVLEQVQLTDHGDQNLNGQSLRHITATLDKNALQQILTTDSQLSNAIGKQNVDKILNATKSLKATLDVWIDETNFYLHRAELKVNVNADLSSLGTPNTKSGITLPSNATVTLDVLADLSKFNQPVTITPPTNAIPTNDPGVIFGGK
ncbi:MAG TPA: LppX_LprAFG lipoprotein [Ktedonobacteraceae bacterium]|nr:LppX_LprAFG lipoprotein [Ktedonobacteraceae bacterium]